MSESSKRKKARDMLSNAGYKSGGHMKGDAKIKSAVHQHEGHDHPGEKKTPIKLKAGGTAHGHKPKHRADRKGRGHTTVNVVVAGQHPKPVPVPIPKPVPVPVDPAMAAGAGAPPPGMPMPPPDGGPQPPMGLKTGGRAKVDSQRDPIKGIPDGQFKKGGRTRKMPVPMDAGAGGAKGRLEKAKDYGART